MGQALAGLLILVIGLIGETLFGWSPSLRDVAFAGVSGAGLAAGLALIAARSRFDLTSRADPFWFTILATVIALPVAIGTGLAARPEMSIAVVAAMTVLRTLVGMFLSIYDLFIGGLGIGRPWWKSPWSAVFLAFAALIWLVPLVPRLTFEAVPLLGFLGLWLVLLIAIALGAFRFYTIDNDLHATPTWSALMVAVGLTGLLLSIAVLLPGT